MQPGNACVALATSPTSSNIVSSSRHADSRMPSRLMGALPRVLTREGCAAAADAMACTEVQVWQSEACGFGYCGTQSMVPYVPWWWGQKEKRSPVRQPPRVRSSFFLGDPQEPRRAAMINSLFILNSSGCVCMRAAWGLGQVVSLLKRICGGWGGWVVERFWQWTSLPCTSQTTRVCRALHPLYPR